MTALFSADAKIWWAIFGARLRIARVSATTLSESTRMRAPQATHPLRCSCASFHPSMATIPTSWETAGSASSERDYIPLAWFSCPEFLGRDLTARGQRRRGRRRFEAGLRRAIRAGNSRRRHFPPRSGFSRFPDAFKAERTRRFSSSDRFWSNGASKDRFTQIGLQRRGDRRMGTTGAA